MPYDQFLDELTIFGRDVQEIHPIAPSAGVDMPRGRGDFHFCSCGVVNGHLFQSFRINSDFAVGRVRHDADMSQRGFGDGRS